MCIPIRPNKGGQVDPVAADIGNQIPQNRKARHDGQSVGSPSGLYECDERWQGSENQGAAAVADCQWELLIEEDLYMLCCNILASLCRFGAQ
jgi:hypothetical protein